MTGAAAAWAMALALAAVADAEPLTVAQCTARALEHAPALASGAAETDAAAARLGEARAAYLPSVLAHGDYGKAHGYDEAVTNGGSTQAVARMEATVFDGGARRAGVAAARARLRSLRARAAQQRADVALAVRTAYATALASRAEVTIDGDGERSLRSYAKLIARQDRIGAANENDVLRAELAIRASSESRRAAAATRDAALAELASLTGAAVAADSLVEFDAAFDPAWSQDVADAPAVIDARETADAARRDAAAIAAERFGKAMLTADVGAIGVGVSDTLERRAGAQFLLGFDVPLFDGGARDLRVAAARADARSAEAKLAEATRAVELALVQAAAEARRAQVDAAAARQSVALAERNFVLMEARHLGGGNVRLLEVLDALTQVSTLRIASVHADLALRLAAARAANAVGEVPR